MGCRLSKDETSPTESNIPTMSKNTHAVVEKADYKSRFERKMCLAKETPEPDFDLSECNLKTVPPGVFVLCRVLRKEILDLSCNQLNSISTAGELSDLSLLFTLNLRQNKLIALPEDLSSLENLRELLISDNLLKRLPQSIRTLRRLELLDISRNKIDTLDEIHCMPALRILNVSQNARLKRLPSTLATCDSLHDLVLDGCPIEWPSAEIICAGTENILNFLTTGESEIRGAEVGIEANEAAVSREDALMESIVRYEQQKPKIERKPRHEPILNDGYGNEDALMEQLQLRQQRQQQELLQAVLQQQNDTENLVNQVQQKKDQERGILIKDIKEAEENANLLIEQLLALRSGGPDPVLIEKEHQDEQRLLEKLHLKHSELRKQEILSTMLVVLHEEDSKLMDYQEKRDITSKDILEREIENSNKLKDCFRHYEQNRNDIIQKIYEDEELQKQAVVTLIEMNDARTWGLVEQLKIVETQLASMTQLEIDKKAFSSAEQMNDFAEKRSGLTFVLMDLLDQQENRKRQLLDTLRTMEQQKHNEEDFWLLQYQRLIDSRPLEFSLKSISIDPLLGFNFLVNGVIHCLPFLQKLWQNTNIDLEKITANDLLACGVRQENDQKLILKSIRDFLKENENSEGRISSRPSALELSASAGSSSSSKRTEAVITTTESAPSNLETLAECVVCMERSVKIIFLPCGHMCCCYECQQNINLCPMCRTNIERKIKVLQP